DGARAPGEARGAVDRGGAALSTVSPIRCIAIANRGEAAMRCIRSVKALREAEGSSLRCVALYTAVDRAAPFVRHADAAVLLDAPPGPAVRAYLDREALLEAIVGSGADAVWPGWGFVAEDADFADAVVAAGLRFLGPPGDVMRALGDKIRSKHAAERAGVPLIPWSGGELADLEAAKKAAAALGYPVVCK